MQIVRVYAASDGESYFEDMAAEQLSELVNRVGEGDISLNTRPPGHFLDYHHAPRRQYVLHLAGTAEYETADGSTRRLGPGDVLVAEDLTGHGHTARTVGDVRRYSLGIPLAAD